MNESDRTGETLPSRFRPEILAPGGSLQAIEAAMAHGADAVYAGIGSLNARVRAQNLTEGQLPGVVEYVHSFGARFYAALNVPLQPGNVAATARTLALCHDAGIDAVIVRDPVLMELVHSRYPGLEIHASTQYGAADVGSVRAARDLGCQRVILARECSRDDIARIRAEVPDVDLEVFVFGAQCFGVSGGCLIGHAVSGRSGNYGACSQSCRLPWFDPEGRTLGYPFSMKDLDLFPHLETLCDLGVTALKIEGRMKPPAWVGCVVHWLRKALDRPGRPGLSPDDLAAFNRDVSVLFSRPRTAAYFEGRTDASELINTGFPGHRGLDVGEFRIVPGTTGNSVRFRTPVDLNIRDGLLLAVPDTEVPGGLDYRPVSIRELNDEQGRPCFRISAGRVVEIPIDDRYQPRGVAIHSSDPVRVQYERVERPIPASVGRDEQPSPRFESVQVGPDRIAAVLVRGRHRHRDESALASQTARNEGLSPALATRYFGDANYTIEPGLYVNPTLIKEIRRNFLERFEAGRSASVDREAREIAMALEAQIHRFQPPDETLLSRGTAALSHVTGIQPGEVRTSGGEAFEIRAHDRATVLRHRPDRSDRSGMLGPSNGLQDEPQTD
jgi:collagenase-like PrtC family protease